jgi:hypothetical protein
MSDVKYCKKCSVLTPLEYHYKSKNVRSYPDGRIDWCKKCMKEYKKVQKVSSGPPVYKVVSGLFTFDFD